MPLGVGGIPLALWVTLSAHNEQCSGAEVLPVSRETEAAREAAAEAERVLHSNAYDALERGALRLREAAELGSGRATARLAHFVAAGVCEKPDWDKAVDLLQRSAELGWTPARKELRLLARGEGDTPKAMRKRVDIRAWIAPRQTKLVSTSPRIHTISSFMTPQECAWFIELGAPKLQPATVYDNDNLGSQQVYARTNQAAALDVLHIDVVSVFLTARMANSIGLPSTWFEPPTLLHYAPGEEFLPHYDFLDAEIPGQAAEMQRAGQRIATFLVYLNHDYDGGETAFPRIAYQFKGNTGEALIFGNVLPSGAPDKRTMHAGRPPTRGEKWLLSQWVRDRNTAGDS
jgi:hypothetical protein